MKKIANVFLTLVFVIAIVNFIACFAGATLLGAFAKDIIAEFANETDSDLVGDVFVVSMIAVCVICALVCVGSIIVCSLTKKKLKVATNRNQMLPYAILNIIFGSTVAAIMLFVMGNHYYQQDQVVSNQ